MKKPEFNVSLSVPEMRRESEALARYLGLEDRDEIDQFRHAYTSAKVQEAIRNQTRAALKVAGPVARVHPATAVRANTIALKSDEEKSALLDKTARIATSGIGEAVEWYRHGRDHLNTMGRNFDGDPTTKSRGNPRDEWDQDVFSNTHGQNVEQELERAGLSLEEKENQLQQRLADDVRAGKVKYREPVEETPTEPAPQPEQATDPASYVGNNPGLPAGRKPLSQILNFIQRR